jgi:hypothetical protein
LEFVAGEGGRYEQAGIPCKGARKSSNESVGVKKKLDLLDTKTDDVGIQKEGKREGKVAF